MANQKEIAVPKGQKVWERHLNTLGELVEILTSDKEKEKWYLYDVEKSGNLSLKSTGTSPLKLKPVKK